ncbi:MAG: family 1 glycosylhydrolase [Candidatus Obscuribacterales bacterium]|nr:family 1 glycosylhydrolase [Candidatus Obscuribacterales bacterium]
MEPSSLTAMLLQLQDEYELPPIYITENGAALDDVLESDGRIHDRRRIAYLDNHLGALASAIKGGVDVRGYFVWSLLDNLKWPLGFKKTFGLIHVDRLTLSRSVKESGLWYKRVIRNNRADIRGEVRNSSKQEAFSVGRTPRLQRRRMNVS